ncbi:flagellar M-ring protein FliF C-terminal domain-containing protein [Anaeromicropila populeti]|uniref:Flagellar M-ring protein FliF n=1 Tax=Anaeromicropila populeti TaxID=37658 RepID=A0A1I6KX73_9FIRM|nr:flagellar M-ring protein FliF C-terminal domain-containing protein [Anaeromicropila populeti]SFR95816.1 flagellar M-ring protein FliF [Anaeromicropila populeti]
MVERVKQIPIQLFETWKKFSRKQKTLILSVIAAVILALVVLYVTLTKVQYVVLYKFEDMSSASAFVELLKEENIKYKLSGDGITVSVDSERREDAMIVMGTNDIPTTGMSWQEALDNSISTTQSEKDQKINLAFQNELRENLLTFENVKDAVVHVTAPAEDNTIFAENKEATVSVVLELSEDMSAEAAKGMAKMLAGAVGNDTTEKITIVDTKANVLFSGTDETGLGGTISSSSEFKEKLRNTFRNNVRDMLLAYGFSQVEVSGENIQFDMDKVSAIETMYTTNEGMEQGLYSSTYNYKTTGTTGSGGIPGTSSNGDSTDYMVESETTSDSETTLDKADYLPNSTVKNIEYEVGAVDHASSSMGVVLTTYKVYDEAELERQGALDGTTWEDFVSANDVRVELEVPDNVIELISQVSGVADRNIAVVSWEQPIFNEKVTTPRGYATYLMIILAVLIIALLIFVVFKSTAPVAVTEVEPELSVEQLLATTKENQSLEDIEFSEKSETRKLIEKFVDENPDAVAQLLRNWLSDDWG